MPDVIRVPRAGTLLITLPSDSTSRWTPLCLASGWQLPAPTADFHRQVTRHAWRTRKNPASLQAGFSLQHIAFQGFQVFDDDYSAPYEFDVTQFFELTQLPGDGQSLWDFKTRP